jgi:hypothetical protein
MRKIVGSVPAANIPAGEMATPRYVLAELLKDTTPEDYRKSAVDWGPDVGREIVD